MSQVPTAARSRPSRAALVASAPARPSARSAHRRARQLRAAAERCARRLYDRYGARAVYLFGSLAGSGPLHDRSDIDLGVVGLAAQRHLAALADLWDLLPLGATLDLVPLELASPQLVRRVRAEGELLLGTGQHGEQTTMANDSGRQWRALQADVDRELQDLGQLVAEMQALLGQIGARAGSPASTELRAAAAIVHDFYTGIERMLQRIAVAVDGGLPSGPDWHVQLLRRMAADLTGIRPAVLDEGLASTLAEYLGFRHIVRNLYGFRLDWVRVRPLAEGLTILLAKLESRLQTFWPHLNSA